MYHIAPLRHGSPCHLEADGVGGQAYQAGRQPDLHQAVLSKHSQVYSQSDFQ